MFDFSLYLVTDRGLSRGRSTENIVREAITGGATCVQLREKDCGTRQFIAEARLLMALLQRIVISPGIRTPDRVRAQGSGRQKAVASAQGGTT